MYFDWLDTWLDVCRSTLISSIVQLVKDIYHLVTTNSNRLQTFNPLKSTELVVRFDMFPFHLICVDTWLRPPVGETDKT